MKIENDFQKKVIDYLRRNKIWHFRFQAQSNKYGLPDIICLYRGFFLGLELKADKGSPTELQLKKLEAINYNGGIGIILKDLSELEEIIDTINKGEFQIEIRKK